MTSLGCAIDRHDGEEKKRGAWETYHDNALDELEIDDENRDAFANATTNALRHVWIDLQRRRQARRAFEHVPLGRPRGRWRRSSEKWGDRRCRRSLSASDATASIYARPSGSRLDEDAKLVLVAEGVTDVDLPQRGVVVVLGCCVIRGHDAPTLRWSLRQWAHGPPPRLVVMNSKKV